MVAMQQGRARPLAVKYITVHGRRHSDHGLSLPFLLRLSPGSDAAPDALKVRPNDLASLGFQCLRLFAVHTLEQGLVGARQTDRIAVEEHQALQVYLFDAY